MREKEGEGILKVLSDRSNKPLTSNCAGIFKQSMGARNRVGIGMSYRPVRLHGRAELIPRNRFLGSLKVKKFGL